jgi:hypothetical protein
MRLADTRAILGIDPTSRGLAFVYFEGGELLDWGMRGKPRDELGALTRILDLCPADLIVLENRKADGCLRHPRVKRALAAIEAYAREQDIEVHAVPRRRILAEEAAKGQRSKTDIAAAIAQMFRVLEIILPRPRGKYRSADRRAGIFDAAASVIHACGVSDNDGNARLEM